jgi:hypothetical protein
MTLKLTGGTTPLTFAVKRWNKSYNNLSVTVDVPLATEPTKGTEYTAALMDGTTVLYSCPATYQDLVFQGYVDDAGKTVVSVSDLVFLTNVPEAAV